MHYVALNAEGKPLFLVNALDKENARHNLAKELGVEDPATVGGKLFEARPTQTRHVFELCPVEE